MASVVVATENVGKFEEIKSLLHGEFETFYSLRDFDAGVRIDESSDRYVENAMKKARKIGDHFNMWALADDSGLEVEALGGRPGVRSSRYGKDDRDRIERLLRELHDVPWENRKAVFKAYVALYMPERERCYLFYGQLNGIIGFERVGHAGFGYDPVFYVPGLNRYLAGLSVEEKNKISHRGKAILALKAFRQGQSVSDSRASTR
jgi:XTP/dITP diphosphohydrolase